MEAAPFVPALAWVIPFAVMLLGIAALRANLKLHYDGTNMRITNSEAANAFLTREYRPGFGLS